MLDGLAEPDFLLPTRCLGWTVSDVVYHLLGDARRALATLATPAGKAPDVDFISYWEAWKPGGDDAQTRPRAWRAAAAPAAVRLAALAPYPVIATQGHALTVADLADTLAVEATIHHLDMIASVPAAPGPAPGCLALVRRTSTACSAGRPTPAGMTRPTRSRGRAGNRSAPRTATGWAACRQVPAARLNRAGPSITFGKHAANGLP
jgi:hypothetical protein